MQMAKKNKTAFRSEPRLSQSGHDRPRVLIISQVPPPRHGSTVMTETLIRILSRNGQVISLLDRRFSRKNSEVGRASLKKAIAAVHLFGRLLAALARGRPDYCIFFITTRPASFVIDWALSEILRLFKIEIVNYIHTQGYRGLELRGSAWALMARRLIGSANVTVCLGPSLMEDVSSMASGRIVCIPNSTVGATYTSGEVALESPTKRMVFLSNLMPSKGASDFVKASIALSILFPDAEFVVAGADTDSQYTQGLRDQIVKAGLEDRILLVGAVYGRDKWDLLRSATVLAYPSQLDAQPLTIIEAFSCGVPVVAYSVGGIPDLIEDDVNGLLIAAGDLQKFTDSCSRILEDGFLRNRLGESAQDSFSERYSEVAFEQNWLNIFGSSHPQTRIRSRRPRDIM